MKDAGMIIRKNLKKEKEKKIKKIEEKNMKNSNLKKNPDKKIVHNGVACDGCNKFLIIGDRYKCTICNDFDFCEICEEKFSDEHLHPFLKIKRNQHNQYLVKCVLNSENKKSENLQKSEKLQKSENDIVIEDNNNKSDEYSQKKDYLNLIEIENLNLNQNQNRIPKVREPVITEEKKEYHDSSKKEENSPKKEENSPKKGENPPKNKNVFDEVTDFFKNKVRNVLDFPRKISEKKIFKKNYS